MTENRDRRAVLKDVLAVASLWGLVIALFWRIALAGRVLASGDVFTYFYPYWSEATRAVADGRIPLWNPNLFMGAPLLANSQVGVFYPLNVLLWLLLPAHRSVHFTLIVHLCLAALTAYAWARGSLRMGRLGAWATGGVFALGGYLGAQVEHVNQLQGMAWLPLLLLLADRARGGSWKGRLAAVGSALCLTAVLLAGHTQTAFISVIGLSAYGLGPALWRVVREGAWKAFLMRGALLFTIGLVAVLLAAAQIVPTWELSQLSVRARGLPFNERVSFSLSPFYLARAFLPTYGEAVPPVHIEHVACFGVTGLVLAGVGLARWRQIKAPDGRRQGVGWLLVLGLSFSLGLYNPVYLLLARYVPGFAHFRVPARFLLLSVMGLAACVGWGVELLFSRDEAISWRLLATLGAIALPLFAWGLVGPRMGEGANVPWTSTIGWGAALLVTLGGLVLQRSFPRWATGALVAVLLIELCLSSGALPHARATAPQTFTDLRPSIAHLLAAEDQVVGGGERFLSLSDIRFDPGDLTELRTIFGPQLSEEAVYDAVVAIKKKEVLSPNLPMVFDLQAADGFGGGILPLSRYVALQRVFVPGDDVSLDGRLRENLTKIPEDRWLDLFGVRHIITDKTGDAWLDDVFYDLQFSARLSAGERASVADVPSFEANAIGVVSYLDGAEALVDGTAVGTVEVGWSDGVTETFALRAGTDTAEGLYGGGVQHEQAPIGGHFWQGQPEGNDYVTRVRWENAAVPISIEVHGTLPEGEWVVRGISLIDERTGSFQALTLSDQGPFRLVHSGDVKVYENLDVPPGAFLVHEAHFVEDDEAAIAAMGADDFDPLSEVVIVGEAPEDGAGVESVGTDRVRVIERSPERVEVEVDAAAPGYLVLSDAWYPGWRATVDGAPVSIERADLMFRAVAVGAGSHTLVFTFRPASVWIGMGVSGFAGLATLAFVAFALSKLGADAIIST